MSGDCILRDIIIELSTWNIKILQRVYSISESSILFVMSMTLSDFILFNFESRIVSIYITLDC